MPPEAELCCTAGFNRTGFVVCSYLCEAQGFSVGAALAAFAAVRPPGVKHEKFIAELYDRWARLCRLSICFRCIISPQTVDVAGRCVTHMIGMFPVLQGEHLVSHADLCMPRSTACLASVQAAHGNLFASGTAATTSRCRRRCRRLL